MDRTQPSTSGSSVERQLANLKILSRLLSHELKAQSGPRLTISREEVQEIQTTIDLFIEDVMRRRGGGQAGEVPVQTIPARMN
ncbi:MAG: hypothetical protein O7B99_08725 [Planctomycetota bacterium]|nr:hypothetical protein [Planctomycetota bacterium]